MWPGVSSAAKDSLEVILNQTALLKQGLLLEYLTLGWNVVGIIIVILAAYAAHSMALAGFGLDSLIEFLRPLWSFATQGRQSQMRASGTSSHWDRLHRARHLHRGAIGCHIPH